MRPHFDYELGVNEPRFGEPKVQEESWAFSSHRPKGKWIKQVELERRVRNPRSESTHFWRAMTREEKRKPALRMGESRRITTYYDDEFKNRV